MTYSDLVSRLKAYLIIEDDGTDPTSAFQVALPAIIEQGELRCLRDVDFLAARVSASVTLSANVATFSAPSDWLIGRYIQLPAGARLLRRDASFLAEIWPDTTQTGVPKYWAESLAGTLLIAPTPATTYGGATLVYTSRLAGLSASNTSTWLATHAPDMLLYACLVAGSGYTKNFGAASENPQQAMSWESAYQGAKTAAEREEARRKGDAPFDAASPAAPPTSNGQ